MLDNVLLLGFLLAGAACCFLMPRWMLLMGAVVVSSVPAMELGSTLAPLQASDVFLLAFGARWVGRKLFRAGEGIRLGNGWWLLAFIGWAWVSLYAVESFTTLPALGRVSLYALMFIAASDDAELIRPLVTFFAFYAMLQAILAISGITPSLGTRLLGTLGDPAQFGLLMVAGLACAQALVGRLRWLVSLIVAVALVMTSTRGIWTAGAVELIVILLPSIGRRLWRVVLVTATVLAVAYAALPVITASLSLNPASLPLRLASWAQAIDFIKSYPLYGVGWALGGVAHLVQGGVRQALYNLWLNVGASTGVPGVLLLSAFLFFLMRQLVARGGAASRAVLIFVAGFLVVSLAEMTIYAASATTIVFFILAGAGVAEEEVMPRPDAVAGGTTRLPRSSAWTMSDSRPMARCRASGC